MAMKFKIFRKEEVSDKVMNDFYSNNIIHKDKFLENGDIYIFYSEKGDLEVDPISKLETISATIAKAQNEIFVAQIDLQENIMELEDVRSKIAESNPNAGKDWTILQENRVQVERQIKLNQHTIQTREKQVSKLKEAYKTIMVGKDLSIEVPAEKSLVEPETPEETSKIGNAVQTKKKKK